RETESAGRCVAEDGLQLEELREPRLAPFAAVAGLLVAAKRGAEIGLCTVHVHVSRSDPLCDPSRTLEVARGDVAGEAVRRVVRDAQGIALVLVGNDRED